jgi:hypothetical protein
MQQSGRLQDDGGTQNSCRVVRCQALFPVREFWLSPVVFMKRPVVIASGVRTSELERKTILTRGAQAMKSHQDAVIRLAEVPWFGSGFCATNHRGGGRPGQHVPLSRSAKGNKCLRRVLNHAAHAAVAKKAVIFRLPSAVCCLA